MLYDHMERAFAENPRGELYRTLKLGDLWNKLEQNLQEIEVALSHGGNDVGDKLADAGNYIAFIYRIIFDPLEGASDPVNQLKAQFHGLQITFEQAQDLHRFINQRTTGVLDVSGFGEHPYTRVLPAAQGIIDHQKRGLRTNWEYTWEREEDDRGKVRQAHPGQPD